jgi:hypothetical protein
LAQAVQQIHLELILHLLVSQQQLEAVKVEHLVPLVQQAVQAAAAEETFKMVVLQLKPVLVELGMVLLAVKPHQAVLMI